MSHPHFIPPNWDGAGARWPCWARISQPGESMATAMFTRLGSCKCPRYRLQQRILNPDSRPVSILQINWPFA